MEAERKVELERRLAEEGVGEEECGLELEEERDDVEK